MNSANKIFLAAMLLILLWTVGGYFIVWNEDFNRDCEDCITSECQDLDPVCGDFGLYYLKIFWVVMVAGIIFAISIYSLNDTDDEEKEEPIMKTTQEQKEFLVEWFRSQGVPDYGGYMGHYEIPENIMEIYREKYPTDWGNYE